MDDSQNMIMTRDVTVENTLYTVTISDESKALRAAYAAGGAVIGVINDQIPEQELKPAHYVVEKSGDIDLELLEQVVRRRNGLPWVVLETERLVIREFSHLDDLPPEEAEGDFFQVFTARDKFLSYIDHQYAFYGYGIWALVDKASGCIIGKAGIDGEELGYHVYASQRKQGYAMEACKAIVLYAFDRLGFKRISLSVKAGNEPSIRLAEKLGFQFSHREFHSILGEICIFTLNPV